MFGSANIDLLNLYMRDVKTAVLHVKPEFYELVIFLLLKEDNQISNLHGTWIVTTHNTKSYNFNLV